MLLFSSLFEILAGISPLAPHSPHYTPLGGYQRTVFLWLVPRARDRAQSAQTRVLLRDQATVGSDAGTLGSDLERGVEGGLKGVFTAFIPL